MLACSYTRSRDVRVERTLAASLSREPATSSSDLALRAMKRAGISSKQAREIRTDQRNRETDETETSGEKRCNARERRERRV